MMKLFCAALTLMVMAAKADDTDTDTDTVDPAHTAFIAEQNALPADLRDCENDGATITGLKQASGNEAFKRARLRIPKSG